MATLSVQLLEELVTCNICLNQYDEGIRKPKFLQCSHTICLECFQAIRNRDTIACPFCRTSTSNGNIYEVEWILRTNQYALDILRLMRTALKEEEEDNQFIIALATRYCREMEEALNEESILDQEQQGKEVTAETDSCDTSNSETFDQELRYLTELPMSDSSFTLVFSRLYYVLILLFWILLMLFLFCLLFIFLSVFLWKTYFFVMTGDFVATSPCGLSNTF